MDKRHNHCCGKQLRF